MYRKMQDAMVDIQYHLQMCQMQEIQQSHSLKENSNSALSIYIIYTVWIITLEYNMNLQQTQPLQRYIQEPSLW